MAMTVQEAEVLFSAKGMDKVRGSSSMAGKAMDALGRRAKSAAGFIGGVGKAAAGLGFAGAVAGGTAMLKLAADAETLNTQFKVLTGSQESASKLMGEIDTFAASTPFQKMDIAGAARQLLAFGGSADTAVEELRMLGDISAATGQPINELAELYGKARVQGRLFGEDVNQLTGRGIPVIEALAKEFGVAEGEVKTLVSEGKVGFPELQRSLAGMTGPGGKFTGMMSELSETTAGKFSTFVDNVKLLGSEMGERLLPYANDFLNFATEGIQQAGGFADSFQAAIDTTVTWYDQVSGFIQDIGVIAGVVVADFDLLWSGLFKDIVNYAKAAFDWIQNNSKRMINNLIELATNAPGIVNNAGKALGEKAAFMLGMSDEELKIDPLAGVRMQSLDKFTAPEKSAETQEFKSNLNSTLEEMRKQRTATERVAEKVENPASTTAEAAMQAFVSQEKTMAKAVKKDEKAAKVTVQRGSASSVFNRIQDQLANKEMEIQKQQLKAQEDVKEAVNETTAAIAQLNGMFVPVLG